MAFLQFFGSAIAFIVGALAFLAAKSAIHETFAMTFLIVSAVLFAGGSITSWLRNVDTSVKMLGKLLVKEQEVHQETAQPQSTDQPISLPDEQKHTPERPVSWVDQAKKELASESAKT